MIILIGRAAKTRLRRLQNAFLLPAPADERNPHFVLAGRNRDAHFESRIGSVHVDLELRTALRVAGETLGVGIALRFAPHREALDADAIQSNVELMRLANADDVVVLFAAATEP